MFLNTAIWPIALCGSLHALCERGSIVELTEAAGRPGRSRSWHALGLTYHALFAWAQERGHGSRAAVRKVYLNDPAESYGIPA